MILMILRTNNNKDNNKYDITMIFCIFTYNNLLKINDFLNFSEFCMCQNFFYMSNPQNCKQLLLHTQKTRFSRFAYKLHTK